MIVQSLVGILLLVISASSVAQTYRCSNGGSTYFSDKPCPTENKLQVYAPTPARQTSQYTPTLAATSPVQDHVKYLSSSCASISEAIRTGPARGVRRDVIQGLNQEYNQKCALEDQEARSRVQQDRNQERQLQLAQRERVAKERQQSQMRSDRCDAMRDTIGVKRKREAELNPKEVEVLRGLERTFKEVCISS
jgi:hypothetical protein